MLKYLGRCLVLAVVYYATARLGLMFATIGNAISPMWPPSGVAVAALLWGGAGLWPAIVVASMFANLSAGMPAPAALLVGGGAALEAWLGAWLARQVAPGLMQVGRPRDFFAFVFGAALPAAAVGAAVGVSVLTLSGIVTTGALVSGFVTWTLGDFMGVVSVAPLILAWADGHAREALARWREAMVIIVLLVLVSILGFESTIAAAPGGLAVRWALYPVIAWAAVRFGLRGSSTSIFIVAALATWATVHGHGPFGAYDPIPASWRLGGFLAVTAGTAHAIAFLSAARELTMRSLEVSQQRFQGVVQTAMDAIITLDAEGRVRVFNPAAERLFLWRESEVLGHPADSLIPERARAAHHRGLAMFSASGEVSRALPHGGRIYGLRRDGTEFPADAAISTFEAGGARFYTIIMRDVSERLRFEQALGESEARLDAILGSMGEIVWSVAVPEERMIYCSAAVETIYGRSRERMMTDSQVWRESVHPADRELVRATLRQLYTDGTARVEHRIVRPDGEVRWVRVRMSLTRDADGVPVRVDGASSDITRARDLEAQLRESQKLEAVGTLAGGIAHDFNNILTAIAGNAELLRHDPALRGESAESVTEILQAANRARDLSQQILVFSRRREATERRTLDLAQVARDALKLIRATVPSTVRIDTDLPSTPVAVRGDLTQLHQVVTNLCTNAWHAMREGGTMSVRVCVAEVTHALAGASPLPAGRYARLSVSDTGVGMSDDIRRRIFEPFFTTKPVGEGSGLGLSVVHGIVVEHGGSIAVESAKGHGTRFDVFLPLSEEPLSTAPGVVTVPPTGEGRCVLVVEDEPAVAKVLVRGLERLGFRVRTTPNPLEALASFTARPEEVDVVVTDLTMPAMTGVELAKRLLAVRANLPVILYSGDVTRVLDTARAAGIREVLEKPVSIADLASAIRVALG